MQHPGGRTRIFVFVFVCVFVLFSLEAIEALQTSSALGMDKKCRG